MNRSTKPESPSKPPKTLPQAQAPALEPPLTPIQTPEPRRARNVLGTQIGTRWPGPAARDPATTRQSRAAQRENTNRDVVRGAPGWRLATRRRRSRRGRGEVSLRDGGLGYLLARDRSAAAAGNSTSTRPHKRSEVGIGEWRSAAAAKYYPTPPALATGASTVLPPRRVECTASLRVGRRRCRAHKGVGSSLQCGGRYVKREYFRGVGRWRAVKVDRWAAR